ncbi:MAG: HEAT repeat domain-containing protein [Isosphaerales bacterium]
MTPIPCWVALASLVLAGASVYPADDVKPDTASPPTATHGQDRRPWLTDLAQGRAQAIRLRRPILVRVGAEWCPWCRKLDVEFARPEVQNALARWTLVELDADKAQAEVGSLAVGPIPALRVLTPAGRVLASRDGSLPARELIAWLEQNHEKAAEQPPAELTDSGAPSAVAVIRLVRQLDQSDALLREAAINRLGGYPNEAAAPVVAAFAGGSLQTRLAALELLATWNAPVAELDPWRPATVTEARLKELRDWSTKPVKLAPTPGNASPSPTSRPVTPTQLAEAGREIDRLIAAEPADAAPIRERLARFGRALLPAVRERLNRVETDAARERLTALRYRLAAADALVLKWPGGLERLSATDVATRHRAVDELLQLAALGDEPLFLELFNDPDPLVRETALKGLNAIGDAGDSQPLLALLADPDPNVRAAVLKQLAEHPAPRFVSALSEYLARETDPDLVVHAVRVLRELNGSKALKVLVGLLEHENWSVRAEAVEAIGKKLENSNMGSLVADDAKIEAYAALTERLDDPDGFVVGRVLTALKDGNLLVAVEPLLRAADKHPELAAKVIETLFSGPSERPAIKQKALPRLRKFGSHPRADVRAAVVKALGDPSEKVVEPEVQAGLSDPESEVRIAAAQMLLSKLIARRPQGSADPEDLGKMAFMIYLGFDPADEGAAEEKDTGETGESSIESWLTRFQEGKGRPSWMEPSIAPLVKMLKAPSVEERLAAALPLIALGRKSDALPTLIEAARRRPDFIGEASQALPWLHRVERLDVFRMLLAANPGSDQFSKMAGQLVAVRDTRTVGPLWDLTTRGELDPQTVYAIDNALRRAYFGARAITQQKIPKAERGRVVADARPKAESGPEWQRLLALGLLLSAAPDDAAAAARSIINDPKAPPPLRRDAFQILLISGDSAQAQKEALDALRGREPAFQKLALFFLASDSTSLSTLREALHLQADTPAFAKLTAPRGYNTNALSEPIPTLPKEVTPELLRPSLKAVDPEIAALTGFALALLGDSQGLEPLLSYWRKQAAKNPSWDKRVYQAVAQLGDDSQIAALEQIYSGARSASASSSMTMDTPIIKDLYWTIRGMDGPNARRLRQRIRSEVGMPFLRGEASEATPF